MSKSSGGSAAAAAATGGGGGGGYMTYFDYHGIEPGAYYGVPYRQVRSRARPFNLGCCILSLKVASDTSFLSNL